METTILTPKAKRILSNHDIYEILRKEILSLKILPGQALSENQMTTRFNISRTPVRSVFTLLQQNGLIEIVPKKGSYVSLINLDIAEQTIFMRIQVELAAMRYLARHPDAQLFGQLERNLALQKEQIDHDVIDSEFYRADNSFHELCMASFGKLKIWQVIQEIEVHYSRYRLIDYHQTNVYQTLYNQHHELFQLMTQGNVDDINRAITEHLYGGILRFNASLLEEHAHLFTQGDRTMDEIVRDVKLMINETY